MEQLNKLLNELGISKDDQEFIFNRFEQGKGSDSTKVSSSGIGLTLVKYIVELHNGNIDVKSHILVVGCKRIRHRLYLFLIF